MKNNVMAKRIAVTLLSGALAFSSVMPVAAAPTGAVVKNGGTTTYTDYLKLVSNGTQVVTADAIVRKNEIPTGAAVVKKVKKINDVNVTGLGTHTAAVVGKKYAITASVDAGQTHLTIAGEGRDADGKIYSAGLGTDKEVTNLDLSKASVTVSNSKVAKIVRDDDGNPYLVFTAYGVGTDLEEKEAENKDVYKAVKLNVTVTLTKDQVADGAKTSYTTGNFNSARADSTSYFATLTDYKNNGDLKVKQSNALTRNAAAAYAQGKVEELFAGEDVSVTVTVNSDNFTAAKAATADKVGVDGSFTAHVLVKNSDESKAAEIDIPYTITANAYNETFSDVADGKYYSKAVNWAVSNGIANGYTNGSFGPNDKVTRAQFVTFLYRQSGVDYKGSLDTGFKDTTSLSDEFKTAIAWAKANGIVNGKSATEFDPNGTVTRAEAVTFLYRDLGNVSVSAKVGFEDVTDGAYYADAVAWGSSITNKQDDGKIINGTDATHFSPNADTTRGQAVTFIYRALGD